MKVYKLTDKISLKIDEIEIKFSPLSYQQKQEVLSVMTEAQKEGSVAKMNDGIILALKYSLKSVSGLKNDDETDYQITFENEMVSQDSIETILNLPMSSKMQTIAGKLLNGVPSDFEIEGVSYIKN